MRKNGKTTSYFGLVDRLDDEINAAAWSKSGLKPNGHLELGTYYWPKVVQGNLESIKTVVTMAKRDACLCNGKKKHKRNGCVHVRKGVARALTKLKLKRSHKKKIARTTSILAHTKKASADRSSD